MAKVLKLQFQHQSFLISPTLNIQGWFLLGLTGLISLLLKGLSKSSPAPQLKSFNSLTSICSEPKDKILLINLSNHGTLNSGDPKKMSIQNHSIWPHLCFVLFCFFADRTKIMILKSSRIRICLKSKDKHTYKIEKEKTHRDTQKDTEGNIMWWSFLVEKGWYHCYYFHF